jgi:hypothetical protein
LSELYRWQFKDFFQNDRKKLIQLLISEIIFLNHCLNNAKKKKERKIIKKGLKKLEVLLNEQNGQISSFISEDDYKYIMSIIFQIFSEIIKKLK